MAYSSQEPLDALVTLLAGVTGIQQAQAGIVESPPYRFTAGVALGGQGPDWDTFTSTERRINLYVLLRYRLSGDESTAETVLGAALDDLETQLLADPTLGGTVAEFTPDFDLADDPEYALEPAKEYRRYPFVLRCVQRESR